VAEPEEIGEGRKSGVGCFELAEKLVESALTLRNIGFFTSKNQYPNSGTEWPCNLISLQILSKGTQRRHGFNWFLRREQKEFES